MGGTPASRWCAPKPILLPSVHRRLRLEFDQRVCAVAAQASRKPCVLVTASEGADAVAGKSGCSFAALPAHFGLDTVEVRLIRAPALPDGSAG